MNGVAVNNFFVVMPTGGLLPGVIAAIFTIANLRMENHEMRQRTVLRITFFGLSTILFISLGLGLMINHEESSIK